jgi:hypothetical protein
MALLSASTPWLVDLTAVLSDVRARRTLGFLTPNTRMLPVSKMLGG